MKGQSISATGDSARTAWIGVGAPILGLVLVTIIMAVAIFAGFAREQDRGFEGSSQRLVASAMDGRVRALGSVTLDYTNWNEAFDAVVTRWDAQWVEQNFYSSTADGMVLFRANSTVRYVWFADASAQHNSEIAAAAVRAAVATPNLRGLIRSPEPANMVSRTYVRVGDQLVAVALAPFSREDDADRLAQAPRSQDFLALIDIVTPAELRAMGASLDLDGLALTPTAPASRDQVSLGLTANNGVAVGALAWRHEHPGSSAFQSRLWPVVLGLLLIGALAVLVARRLVMRQVSALAHASAALEASRSKSEFLTRVSHELRTPLDAIVGYAELIEEESEIAATREDAGRIVMAARQLAHLINDIIDQSRVDAGRMKFYPEPLPIAGMVAEVHGLIRPSAMAAGVNFTSSSEAGAGFAFADHVRLRQCLLNILGNAVKFAGGGSVSLRALLDNTRTQPMVLFIVKDTGIGMSQADIAEIFRPFGQANAEIGKKFGGTGLGLSIARELALAMGGDISVVSEPGEGATFTLAVPAATAQSLKTAA